LHEIIHDGTEAAVATQNEEEENEEEESGEDDEGELVESANVGMRKKKAKERVEELEALSVRQRSTCACAILGRS
jgi:hypothetical protein